MRTITTEDWKRADLPFEGWLKYAQLRQESQRVIEGRFFARFPHLLNDGYRGTIPQKGGIGDER